MNAGTPCASDGTAVIENIIFKTHVVRRFGCFLVAYSAVTSVPYSILLLVFSREWNDSSLSEPVCVQFSVECPSVIILPLCFQGVLFSSSSLRGITLLALHTPVGLMPGKPAFHFHTTYHICTYIPLHIVMILDILNTYLD
jgi:hypothetical protein